jgi:hypothetical protein
MVQEDELYNSTLSSLYALWREQSLCDVTLRGSDGGRISAHKIVLSASSPFFRALFVGATGRAMRERDAHLIDLPGITSPALHLLLTALYQDGATDSVEAETVEVLLSGASYLSVPKVMAACCAFLSRQLSLDSVVRTIVLASQFDCEPLRNESVWPLFFYMNLSTNNIEEDSRLLHDDHPSSIN